MAEIVRENPGSNEVQSPLMAGFSDALNCISKELNLKSESLSDQPLSAVAIDSEMQNKNRIYEAPFGKKLWLEFPEPVVKKNGVVVQKSRESYSVDLIGGSVTFSVGLRDEDKITVTCSHVSGGSETVQAIQTALKAVEGKADKYKGFFDSKKTLDSKYRTATDGDFAFVATPNFSIFAWDSQKSAWRDTQNVSNLDGYVTSEEADRLLSGKENSIAGNGKPRDYYGGDKVFHDIGLAFRDTQLAGFNASSGGEVDSSDTVLSAIGKLQYQTKNQKSWLSGAGEPKPSTVAKIGQRYVNESNGDWYTCVSVSGNTRKWEKGSDAKTLGGHAAGDFILKSEGEKTGGQFTDLSKLTGGNQVKWSEAFKGEKFSQSPVLNYGYSIFYKYEDAAKSVLDGGLVGVNNVDYSGNSKSQTLVFTEAYVEDENSDPYSHGYKTAKFHGYTKLASVYFSVTEEYADEFAEDTGYVQQTFKLTVTPRVSEENVPNAPLTGFNDSIGGSVSASDTIKSAIGKLQNQSKNGKSWVEGNGKPTVSTVGKLGQRYVDRTTGDWYTCVSASQSNYRWEKGSDAKSIGGKDIRALTDLFLPVGTIVSNVSAGWNPNNVYTGTTWQLVEEGRALRQAGGGHTLGSKAGEAAHKLTAAEIPSLRGNVISNQYSADVFVDGSWTPGGGDSVVMLSQTSKKVDSSGDIGRAVATFSNKSQTSVDMTGPSLYVNLWQRIK